MPAPVLFLEAASGHREPTSDAKAEDTLRRFIQTLRHLRRSNRKIGLNACVRLPDCEIAPGRTLQMVLSGPSHRDTWLFLKELNTRTPFSREIESLIKEAEVSETKTSLGQTSEALTWALILETGTVSFFGDNAWKVPWIDATHLSIINSDGNLSEQKVRIRNSSDTSHVDEHRDWLALLGYDEHPTATQLWNDRDSRFPGLRFLAQVRKNFDDIATTGSPYQQALTHLASLNEDAIRWGGNGNPEYSIKVAAGEHDQRRRLSIFRDEITGQDHEFDRHCYFTGGVPGRIHFRLSENEKKFVIGYVGLKL